MISPKDVTVLKKEGLKPLRVSFYGDEFNTTRVTLVGLNPTIKTDDPLSSGQPVWTPLSDWYIAECLIAYTDYDFNNFEDFVEYTELFSISTLVDYSATASSLKYEENIQIDYTENEYSELLKAIWLESKDTLIDIQLKYKQLINICLVDGCKSSWTYNIGIQERTYIYLKRNPEVAKWLRSIKYTPFILNLDYLVDYKSSSSNIHFIEKILFSNEKQLGSIAEQFSNSVKMMSYEDYYTYDIVAVLALVFWKMVLQKRTLKICKICKKIFLPINRSDEEYCSRVSDNGRTCRQIGANRTYMNKKSVIGKLYLTRYKTLNARKRLTSGYKLNDYELKKWQQIANERLPQIESQYENADSQEERESIYSNFKNWLYDERIIDNIKSQLRKQ